MGVARRRRLRLLLVGIISGRGILLRYWLVELDPSPCYDLLVLATGSSFWKPKSCCDAVVEFRPYTKIGRA